MDSQSSPPRKALATAVVLALFALLGLVVWLVSRRGPSVSLTIKRPALTTILPVGTKVEIRGRVTHHKGPVECNYIETQPDSSGRFTVRVDPPERPGLFTLTCKVRNEAGRVFHFRYGRLAGPHAPISRKIQNAVVARIPLKMLNEPGGILAELQQLVGVDLTRRLNQSLSTLKLTLPTIRIGPVSVDRIILRSIEPTPQGMIRFRLALNQICLNLGRGSASWKIGSARISAMVPRKGRICLPAAIPMNVDLKLTPGKPVQVHAGPLTTTTLEQLSAFEPLLSGGHFLNGLSRRLTRALTWPSRKARSILESLRKAHATLNARLAGMTDLLRPTPTRWAKIGVRVCMKVELDRLHTLPEKNLASFHLSARIYGTTRKDAPCKPGNIHPLPKGKRHFRLILPPPSLAPTSSPSSMHTPPKPTPPKSNTKSKSKTPPGGAWQHKHIPLLFRPRPAPAPSKPVLHISVDLVNAYLAAMWAGNGLKNVPVKMSEAKDQGFDIQRASFILPPAIFPEPQGGLRLDAAELELIIRAKGEPRRLFRLNATVPLKLYLSTSGRLELNVVAPKLSGPSIRCIGELDGTPCSAQSRRYQDLVEISMELMNKGELSIPDLGLEAALPVWRSDTVDVKAENVRIRDRTIEVELAVKPR